MANRKIHTRYDQFEGHDSKHRRFIPMTVYRGLESQEAHDRRRAAQNEIREIERHEQNKRYRVSRNQAQRYLADSRIRKYWLTQAERAFSQPVVVWRNKRLAWPEDRPIIYAVMLLCADDFSKVRLLPESWARTKAYEQNKNVTWVLQYGSAGQFMAYIENDLKAKGFLEQGGTTTPPASSGNRNKSKPLESEKQGFKINADQQVFYNGQNLDIPCGRAA